MPDPISPLGAPGQIQPLNPSPNPAPEKTSGEGSVGPAAQAVPSQPASVLGLSEATQKELEQLNAKLESKTATAPMSLEEAVKSFREFLKNLPSDLQFRPDKESGYVIFKVVNPVTQEVIRQYPPDAIVEMARRLKAAAQHQGKSGIFLDKKL